MSAVALPAGVVTSPMLVLALRRRSLGHGLLYAAGLPLITIIVFAPLSPAVAFFFSFPAYGLGCMLAWRFAEKDCFDEPIATGASTPPAHLQVLPTGGAVIQFCTVEVERRPAVELADRSRLSVIPGLALATFLGSTCSCFAGAGFHWVAGAVGVSLTALFAFYCWRRWELIYPEGGLLVSRPHSVEHSVVLTRDNLAVSSQGAMRRWAWPEVDRVEIHLQTLEICLMDGTVVGVPRLPRLELAAVVAILRSFGVVANLPPCPCRTCGYDVQASLGDTCPECGGPVESA